MHITDLSQKLKILLHFVTGCSIRIRRTTIVGPPVDVYDNMYMVLIAHQS